MTGARDRCSSPTDARRQPQECHEMTTTKEPCFVTVGCHRLSFRRSGQGPSVVLLHGIPTHSFLWRHVVPRLVPSGLQVITFDLLGYGLSDKPGDIDLGISAQARVIAAALSTLQWPGGVIAGHDIGGGVAQLIALSHPQLVTGLALVDSIAYDSFPEPGIAR